jgi:phosphate starvation-inducible protein PhoH and related proteins
VCPGGEGPLTDSPTDPRNSERRAPGNTERPRGGGADARAPGNTERPRGGGADARAPEGTEVSPDGRTRVKIVIPDDHSMVSLLGSRDELLHVIEGAFGADIHVRGNEITVTGSPEETALAARLFDELTRLLASGAELAADVVERSVAMLRRKSGVRPADVLTLDILSARGRTIRPKTLNQKRYVDAIDKHTIVFAIGPAGTGKTYLAMAKAVKALQAKEFNRIILTRPAVEAGERLGFLPGTLYEKIDPYLRPLYDALHDMIDPDSIPKLTAAGTIEIAPLAYMRGRTLNDSFIILDEAQNTSPEQMKMFLTRLGFGSKIVVTGDVTQVDLPAGQTSGLRLVQEILDGVEDVYFSRLTSHDVVRHKLVADIVDAYERYDARRASAGNGNAERIPGARPRRTGNRTR